MARDEENRSIALVGFMGVGKTTIGRRLARRLDYQFADSDSEIERRAGCSVQKLFAEQGEAVFRRLETEALRELAERPGMVISTGGGAVLNPENAALLREHCRVIWLTASPGVIQKRVGSAETRPLLANAANPLAHIRQLLASREPHYAAAAHLRIETTDRRPEAIVDEITRWIQEDNSPYADGQAKG